MVEIGFYGKLPCRGDFIQRGLEPEVVKSFDLWLQQCVAVRSQHLGPDWLQSYLTSPIWRFCFSPQIVGQNGLCGAIMPSVDRVNRHFPMLIVLSIGAANVFRFFEQNQTWFQDLDGILLGALEADDLDLDQFHVSLQQHGDAALVSPVPGVSAQGAHLEVEPTLDWGAPGAALLADLCARQGISPSLWCTGEIDQLLLADGLPDANDFAHYLFPADSDGAAPPNEDSLPSIDDLLGNL